MVKTLAKTASLLAAGLCAAGMAARANARRNLRWTARCRPTRRCPR